jgi:hypothetical protein
VLADYSNVTREGKINILGVFDVIRAFRFPATHPEMQLVIGFEADISEKNHEKEVEVRLIDERGEQLLNLRGRIAVGDTTAGTLLFYPQVLVLRSISFPCAGNYQFDIYVDGERRHYTPLKVVAISQDHNL